MPDAVKPDHEAEPAASGEAGSVEVKKDVGVAADGVGQAASTATRAGEDAIAGTLSRIEGALNDLKESIGKVGAATATAEAPVKSTEGTAEAVVPEVKVTPRKAHWTSGLPKWM